jgi:hypothetical protein
LESGQSPKLAGWRNTRKENAQVRSWNWWNVQDWEAQITVFEAELHLPPARRTQKGSGASPLKDVKLTDKESLEVYDLLRNMHEIVRMIYVGYLAQMDDWQENAIDSVEGVLYLAESVFSKQECSACNGQCVHTEGEGKTNGD